MPHISAKVYGLFVALVASVTMTACATGIDPNASATTSPPASAPGITTSSDASPSPNTSPSPGGGTSALLSTVTITRTGGIAGVMQMVVIKPDGSWTYTDKKTGASQSGKLTQAQVASLTAMATDPALGAEARMGPLGVCNDSFVYTISIGEIQYRYDQCSGPTKRPATSKLVNAVVDATPL